RSTSPPPPAPPCCSSASSSSRSIWRCRCATDGAPNRIRGARTASRGWRPRRPPPGTSRPRPRFARIRTTAARPPAPRPGCRTPPEPAAPLLADTPEHAAQLHLAHHFSSLDRQTDAARLAMWLFLATELLLFGGVFTAYSYYRYIFPAAWAE